MTTRRPFFAIRTSRIAGRGAFAVRRIRKGARIIEYLGERISHAEADRRYPDDDTQAQHHTVLFAVNARTVIDGGNGGNEARFINHSCAPNCEAVDHDGRIFIEAMRTIRPGEELTYDYAYEMDGRYQPAWKKIYACRCGTPECRGMIVKLTRKNRPKPRARPVERRKRA